MIDANYRSRVFEVYRRASMLDLSYVTIANGRDESTSGGGAIYSPNGELDVTESVIQIAARAVQAEAFEQAIRCSSAEARSRAMRARLSSMEMIPLRRAAGSTSTAAAAPKVTQQCAVRW